MIEKSVPPWTACRALGSPASPWRGHEEAAAGTAPAAAAVSQRSAGARHLVNATLLIGDVPRRAVGLLMKLRGKSRGHLEPRHRRLLDAQWQLAVELQPNTSHATNPLDQEVTSHDQRHNRYPLRCDPL